MLQVFDFVPTSQAMFRVTRTTLNPYCNSKVVKAGMYYGGITH